MSELCLTNVAGKNSIADLLATHLDGKTLEEHMKNMGLMVG